MPEHDFGPEPWKGAPLITCDEFQFSARVAIAAAINQIAAEIPARWLDRPDGAERHARELAELPPDHCQQTAAFAIIALGWNLSILYAQSTGDGMGGGDALTVTDLETTLALWAAERIAGRRGIRSEPGSRSGSDDWPDCDELSAAWVAAVRRFA